MRQFSYTVSFILLLLGATLTAHAQESPLTVEGATTEPNLLNVAAKDKEVVIYCAGPGCKRSSKACIKAVSWGFTKVYYFRGGLPEWRAAGLPTDPP